jgi:hypothetical protein
MPLDPPDGASATGSANGDLIQYDWEGDGNSRSGHISMVTNVDGGGVEGAGTENDRVNRPWNASQEQGTDGRWSGRWTAGGVTGIGHLRRAISAYFT